MKLNFILTSFVILTLAACAPKVQSPHFEKAKDNFGPRNSDVDLRKKGELQRFDFGDLVTFSAQLSAAPMYRMAENLSVIGQKTQNPALEALGSDLTLAIQKSASSQVAMTDTPYVQLLITETRDEVRQALGELERDLAFSQTELIRWAVQLGQETKWPQGPLQPLAAAQVAADYLEIYEQGVRDLDLLDIVKTQVQTELIKQRQNILAIGQEVEKKLATIRRFADFLKYLEELMIREEMEIPKEFEKTLTDGKGIAQGLLQCQSAQSALSVIVDVWKMLEPAQRKEYFEPVNKDLYELLEGKDEKGLQCLKDENCKGFIRDMLKSMFILPKLEEYGIEKLCGELNDQALGYAKKAMSEQLTVLLPTLPQILGESLKETFLEQTTQLKDIRANYSRFIKERVSTWSESALSLKGQVSGLESSQLKTSLKGQQISMTAVPSSASAEGIGAAFPAFFEVWNHQQTEPKVHLQTGLEMINRLAALGGYPTEFGNMAPALMSPLEKEVPLLDLTRVTELPGSYAVVDTLAVQKGFSPVSPRPTRYDVSAKSQAEVVRGLSAMLMYLRDWESTQFDKGLGLVTANQMVPEYGDIPDLQRSLFPKESLMALTVGDLAVALQNTTKALSAFFVVGLNHSVTWVNDYDFENGDAAVMAGVVDIENGKRKSFVRSEDVSRWILALSLFLEASEGIENTKSPLLTEVDSQGKRPLDTLLDARRQIKLLAVGLTNFLSHQMLDADGFVHAAVEIPGFQPVKEAPKSVLDQALAIRALVKSASSTGVEFYRVSATEIYFNMNSRLFQPRLRFYSFGGPNVKEKLFAPVLVESIRALKELEPHLPMRSQEQLQWLLEPWIQGLSRLRP